MLCSSLAFIAALIVFIARIFHVRYQKRKQLSHQKLNVTEPVGIQVSFTEPVGIQVSFNFVDFNLQWLVLTETTRLGDTFVGIQYMIGFIRQ